MEEERQMLVKEFEREETERLAKQRRLEAEEEEARRLVEKEQEELRDSIRREVEADFRKEAETELRKKAAEKQEKDDKAEQRKQKREMSKEVAKMGRKFISKRKSGSVYDFQGAALQGFCQDGTSFTKAERGQFLDGDGILFGGRKIAITTIDIAKTTDWLQKVSSGDPLQDRFCLIGAPFRTNSLSGNEATKKDWKDFHDVCAGFYSAVYNATGTIAIVSDRSISRAVAVAIAICLHSSKGLRPESIAPRFGACINHMGGGIDISVYNAAFVAIANDTCGWDEAKAIRDSNPEISTVPTKFDMEADGNTQGDGLGDMFDFVNTQSISREERQRPQYIADTGIHDVIPWDPPKQTTKKRNRSNTAARVQTPTQSRKKSGTNAIKKARKIPWKEIVTLITTPGAQITVNFGHFFGGWAVGTFVTKVAELGYVLVQDRDLSESDASEIGDIRGGNVEAGAMIFAFEDGTEAAMYPAQLTKSYGKYNANVDKSSKLIKGFGAYVRGWFPGDDLVALNGVSQNVAQAAKIASSVKQDMDRTMAKITAFCVQFAEVGTAVNYNGQLAVVTECQKTHVVIKYQKQPYAKPPTVERKDLQPTGLTSRELKSLGLKPLFR